MKRFALAAALAALTGTLIAQSPDRGPDRENAEALSRRAGDRLQSLQVEADRLASEERTILGDLRKLEIAREIKSEELRQAAAKAAGAATELAGVNSQVKQLEQADVAARPELRARVVELYKLGQGRYLRLLLSMSDVRSIGQASRLVGALAKRDRDRVDAHERTLRELKTSRVALEAKSATLVAARADAERAQSAMDRAIGSRNDAIETIDRERDLNAQLAGELQTAQQKLRLALRDMATPVVAAPSLPLRPFKGDLDWPVTGGVRTPFGRATAGHPASAGIEIAAEDGVPVRAVHEGLVAFAGPFAGFGNLVIVQHEADAFSLYGNLSDAAVARGARIERGQTLGSVGASPTGPPGLYFEIRVGGQAVDPVQWLKRK